jgi:peptidoglycan/LPS O-acetylase OafA/YrhL
MSEMLSRYFGFAPDLARCATGFVGTFFVAAASWYLIEQPILRLKDRIRYSGDATAAKPGQSPSFEDDSVELGTLSLGPAAS